MPRPRMDRMSNITANRPRLRAYKPKLTLEGRYGSFDNNGDFRLAHRFIGQAFRDLFLKVGDNLEKLMKVTHHDPLQSTDETDEDDHLRQFYTHGVFRGLVQGDRLPEPISAAQVRARAGPMSRRVLTNAQYLQNIVERHEVALQRRWEKKSKVKRREMLRSAWASTDSPPPPLAAERRLHIRHIFHRCKEPGCRHEYLLPETQRHIFMWPHLNLEDLCKTEPLLLLINARGRNSPAMFAFADLEPALFGFVMGAVPSPPFLNRYNMRFTCCDNPESYGKLVSWADDPEACRRLYRGRDTSPGEGLWILDIQDRLYKFLVATCRLILHDIPLDNADELLARPVEAVRPAPTANILSKHGTVTSPSFMMARLEAQYHVPANLNMRRLQSLIAAKLAETEDTLWAMREDPGTFANTVLEMYEARPELLLDRLGRPHPKIATADGRSELVADVINDLLSYTVPAVEVWGFLHDKVAQLAEQKESEFDSAGVLPDDELPGGLAITIYLFLAHLKWFIQTPLSDIFRQVRLSPPMRHLVRVASHKRSTSCGKEEEAELIPSDAKLAEHEADYLYLVAVTGQGFLNETMGLHNCVEELETLASDPVRRRLISPPLARKFSDITILSECIRQIELFQPWASTFRTAMAEPKMAMLMHAYVTDTWFRMYDLFKVTLSVHTGKLGAELAWMKYPVDKRPSKANVDAMRAAEHALDTFWDAAVANFRSQGILTDRLERVLVNGPKLERTPAWVEPPEKAPKEEPQDFNAAQPFGGMPMGVETRRSSDERPKSKAKNKVKSRGVPRPPVAELKSLHIDEAPPPQPARPRFLVDRRAYSVFDMLFYRPLVGAASRPGEIPWVEFVYAMHHVGFSVERLGGSAWQFTPGPALEEHEYARGIQFHEPHPVAKIPFRMARMHGRRLARAYGWCADLFQLEDK